MKIEQNEGLFDRLIRFLVAEILFLLSFFWLNKYWGYLVYFFSVLMLITSLTGFCGLYKLLKINTTKHKFKLGSGWLATIFGVIFLIVAIFGSYYSIFFTKKIFLEDYNQMNNYYKQTLFYTGQDKRLEALDNYTKLITEYNIFYQKYKNYRPYVFLTDSSFTSDLSRVKDIILSLEEQVSVGDLKDAHTKFETIRPIFQGLLKRNGFSMLAVYLVDFHDAMEKIITTADAKDVFGLIAIYPEVDNKLREVENIANDIEIQNIRKNLDEIYNLAKENKAGQLSAKAAELKSSFVKVYLKRG